MAFDVMVPLGSAGRSDPTTIRSVVVLTGAAGVSSGADHKSAGSVPHVEVSVPARLCVAFDGLLDDVILAMRRLHQPVIAAVSGAAIGAVIVLSLAADIGWRRMGRTSAPLGSTTVSPPVSWAELSAARGHRQLAPSK